MLGAAIRAFAFLAFATAHVAAQGVPAWSWQATNPGGGGYFMRIGSGPTGIMVACSDLSGPYLSRDRGQSWQAIGPAHGITNTHAACVGFHAQNPALVYIGSGSGLFRSRDFGHSFDKVISNGSIENVAIAPANDQIAYTAWHAAHNTNTAEIRRSTDGGSTWQRVDVNLSTGLRVLKLLVSPSDSNMVYAMTGQGRFVTVSGPRTILRSDDGGV